MKRTLTFILLSSALLAAPGFGAHVGIWDAQFQLDAGQEVPKPNRGSGLGQCVASLQGDDLTLSCTHNLTDAAAAHIHLGAAGQPGPVLLPLGDGSSPIQGKFTLTAQQKAYYHTGSLYVNVHTVANAAGEIRGQIVPSTQPDAQSLLFSGDPSQETEAVTSDAVAHCRAILTNRTGVDQVRVICAHTVEGAVAAHIHRAAPGQPGPVLFPFASAESPLDQTFDLSNDNLDDLLTGGLYVNIHSPAYPSGEVRANLTGCFSSATQLCLQDNRFAVSVAGMTVSGPFVGQAQPGTRSSGEFFFFSPDNLELLVKVLDGCSINDRYWVFFAATTNVEFDVTVTDTRTTAQVIYNNAQGNPADAVTDIEAFASCSM